VSGRWRRDLHRHLGRRGPSAAGPGRRAAPSARPKVATLLEDAEADLLAFYGFPAEHWPKLRSTNPLERVNREIGRRSDVVGIFPNDQALLRLAGMLLLEQNDEWLVGRRYLSETSLALVLATDHPDPATTGSQEVAQLTAS
jgi:putative transposase